jgi:large subunit ribosomal protein L15
VNLHSIAKLDVVDITPDVLVARGLLRKGDLVKVLGYGELTGTVNVTAHAVSKSAEAAIAASGGSVTLVPLPHKVRPPAKGNQFTNR